MALSNCKSCGVLFLKTNFDVCDKCIQAEQDLIQNINDYVIAEGKDLYTFEEIAIKFRILPEKLERFLLERKLVQIMDKLLLKCKSCGVEFTLSNTGRLYCRKCYNKMEESGYSSGSSYNNGNFGSSSSGSSFGKSGTDSKYSFKSNRKF